MKNQAEEERLHALKFIDFIIEAGGDVVISGFEDPEVKADDILGIFEQALKHENFVTERINFLVSLAAEEKNYAAVNFLNWFVNEQVEEEATATGIIKSLRMIGNDGNGLYQLDKELGTRPAPVATPAKA